VVRQLFVNKLESTHPVCIQTLLPQSRFADCLTSVCMTFHLPKLDFISSILLLHNKCDAVTRTSIALPHCVDKQNIKHKCMFGIDVHRVCIKACCVRLPDTTAPGPEVALLQVARCPPGGGPGLDAAAHPRWVQTSAIPDASGCQWLDSRLPAAGPGPQDNHHPNPVRD
jgi:hypothetical protein